MRVWTLTIIAAAALSATASAIAADSRASSFEPGTRGPVIQTDAPAPTPTHAPVVLSA
jgi:hypothetical protein